MYYLSKALVFIACLIAACTVNWWTGVIALIVSAVYLRQPPMRTINTFPKGSK